MYTLNQGSVTDFVVNALFNVEGTDGTHTANIGGNQIFTFDSEKSYMAYNQLQPAQVVGWIQSALGPQGVANFEANIDGQIESMVNPPVSPQNTPLPWNTPPATTSTTSSAKA
jgi:hypothetical protein